MRAAPRGARLDPELTLPAQKDLALFEEDAAGNIRGSLSSDIAFVSGSADLRPETVPVLERAADQVSELYPGRLICIEGFADGVGDTASNLDLSQRRAESVRDQLASKGITNELVVRGYGEQFAPDGVPSKAWRRVDLTIDKCLQSDGGQ